MGQRLPPTVGKDTQRKDKDSSDKCVGEIQEKKLAFREWPTVAKYIVDTNTGIEYLRVSERVRK